MENASGEPTRAILVEVTKELGEFVISKYRNVHKRDFRKALENDINRLHGTNKFQFKSKKHILEQVDFSAWSNFIDNLPSRNVEIDPNIRSQLRDNLGELRGIRNFWAHPTAIPYTSREYRDIVRLSKTVLKVIGSKKEIDKIVAANSKRHGVSMEEFDAVKKATTQILLDTAQIEENLAQMRADIKVEVLEEVWAEINRTEPKFVDTPAADPTATESTYPPFHDVESVASTSQSELQPTPPDAEKPRNARLGNDFVFGEKSLQYYADCARRFELRFIKRLSYPAFESQDPLQFEARVRQGARFHKLAQQHLLGVPAEALAASLADNDELARWWANYLAHGLTDLPAARYPEITLQAPLAGRRLIATYDLLALEAGGAAVIVDWKTGARVPSQSTLRRRMQTIVYRYVLAQAGAHLYRGESIPPERIRMDYVYVAQGAERLSLAYSAAQMGEDEALLSAMITAIDDAEAFPLTDDERRCRFCSYRSLCDRGGAGRLEDFDLDEYEDENAEEAFMLDFDQIAEIEF